MHFKCPFLWEFNLGISELLNFWSPASAAAETISKQFVMLQKRNFNDAGWFVSFVRNCHHANCCLKWNSRITKNLSLFLEHSGSFRLARSSFSPLLLNIQCVPLTTHARAAAPSPNPTLPPSPGKHRKCCYGQRRERINTENILQGGQ